MSVSERVVPTSGPKNDFRAYFHLLLSNDLSDEAN